MNLGFTLSGKPVRGHDRPSTSTSAVVKWVVLILPLTLAALLPPDCCSDAFFMMKVEAAPIASAPLAAAPNAFSIGELERLSGGRTAGGDIQLGLGQLCDLASEAADVRSVIESVRIETVGQIVRDPVDPTRWRIFRQVTTCCAADAREVWVTLAYDGDPSQWQALGWYRIVGRIAIDGNRLTNFKIESVAPIEQPRNLMSY